MDIGGFRRNFKHSAGSSSSPQGSPFKKQVVDPGTVQVEIKCDRYAVAARWQFGAEKLKHDLLKVRVPGWSNGLVWNVASRAYMNMERNSVPSAMKLTCPSPDFLKELCRACEASDWCSHWYITSRTGQSILCSAQSIDSLQVDFDVPDMVREEAQSNCDDLRADVRAVMKVHDEFHVPMPWVTSSSDQDEQALRRCRGGAGPGKQLGS